MGDASYGGFGSATLLFVLVIGLGAVGADDMVGLDWHLPALSRRKQAGALSPGAGLRAAAVGAVAGGRTAVWRALGRRPSVPAGDPGGLLWARFFVGGLRMAQCMVKLATGPESLADFSTFEDTELQNYISSRCYHRKEFKWNSSNKRIK